MAGYGGTFAFDPQDHDLLDGLRSVIRRRARATHVQFRCTIERAGRCSYTFVGNTVGLDLLLNRLRRDLPTSAEAMATGRSAATRRRLANGLTDILVRQRLEFHDRFLEDHVPMLRGRSDQIAAGVFGLPRDAVALFPRLWITDDILASWLMNEVPAEVVIEEISTAAEVLLRAVLRESGASSFTDVVESARQRRILDSPERGGADARDDTALGDVAGEAGVDLLAELAAEREPARRRGAPAAAEWIGTNLWPAAHVLQQLAAAAYRELSSDEAAAPARPESADADEDETLEQQWRND